AEGKILLRDIIDLDATYAGPDAKAAPAAEDAVPEAPAVNGAANGAAANGAAARGKPAAAKAPPIAPADGDEIDEVEAERARQAAEEDDEDDFENALSLAAMELELKPKVVATFDSVADF